MRKYFENDVEKPIPPEFVEVARNLKSEQEQEDFIRLCERLDTEGKDMYEILKGLKDLPTRLAYIRKAIEENKSLV